MYITVMDYSTTTISKMVWDVENATTQEVEILLEAVGYNLSQISYMTSEDEPDYGGVVEVTDIMPDFKITKQQNEQWMESV